MSTFVEKRLIVGPVDQEATAVVLIPLPAGGEVEIDPMWRFRGFTRDLTIEGPPPNRVDVVEPEGGWAEEET